MKLYETICINGTVYASKMNTGLSMIDSIMLFARPAKLGGFHCYSKEHIKCSKHRVLFISDCEFQKLRNQIVNTPKVFTHSNPWF